MEILLVVVAGFLISFSGSLPIGNLNLMAMYIASKENFRQAMLFSFGVIWVEMLCLLVVLLGVHWIMSNKLLIEGLEVLSILFLILLATGSFLSLRKKADHKNRIIDNNVHRFLLGTVLSGINPFHLPFWAGWTIYFFHNYSVSSSPLNNAAFIAGAGFGTLSAFLLYIFSGKKFSAYLAKHQSMFHVLMGVLFSIMAIVQIIKLVIIKS